MPLSLRWKAVDKSIERGDAKSGIGLQSFKASASNALLSGRVRVEGR